MKRQDLLSLAFYEKSAFTGSLGPHRYKIEKFTEDVPEGETPQKQLKVAVWRGQFAYDYTPEDEKTYRYFDFSEEGLLSIADWINSLK